MSLLLFYGGNGGAAPEPTYALWSLTDRNGPDPDPVAGYPSLSVDQLTVTGDGAAWRAVRADTSVLTGDWFFQITVDVTNYVMIGVSDANGSLEYAGVGGTNGWGISSHGYNFFPGSLAANGVTFGNGDVMGCSILRSTSEAKFYKLVAGNWSLVYTADISAIDGDGAFPYCSVFNGVGTANFGESAFAAAVPDGANEGVYS